METISVALPAELAERVQQAVADGEYSSPSEVVDEALRTWSRSREGPHPEHLQAAWQEAMLDGRLGQDPEEVFARVRQKLNASHKADSV